MIKVKEWLDNNLFPIGESTVEPRKNGHFGVFGSWMYPKDWKPLGVEVWRQMSPTEQKKATSRDHICLFINNETIVLGNMSADGEWSKYNYLMTYEHIPRGEPDENGYYTRSTDEEIIQYIDGYLQKIKRNETKSF
jgi:hypothetical protein